MKTQFVLLGCLALSSCLAHISAQTAPAQTAEWTVTTWNGERAFAIVTTDWRAIVSVERGRLVHFGPAEPDAGNLLLEVPTRDDERGWAGHRVWLGPQELWGWPPPAAWESSAAADVKVVGDRLELVMPETGQGYPPLTRIYEIAGKRLACRVAVAAGGTKAVQVIQILPPPPETKVELRTAPSAQGPRGYFRVSEFSGPRFQPDFPRPEGIEEVPGGVVLSVASKADKLAFPPQTLVARIGAYRLSLAFGECRGPEAATPDDGFYTQVYTGHPSFPVVELEQFSPQWQAGAAGEFTMYVSLSKRG